LLNAVKKNNAGAKPYDEVMLFKILILQRYYGLWDASVHDSQALDDLLEEKDKDQELHANSAYTGEEQEKTIAKYELKNNVH